MPRHHLSCPACGHAGHLSPHSLNRRVSCPRCTHAFKFQAPAVEELAPGLLRTAPAQCHASRPDR